MEEIKHPKIVVEAYRNGYFPMATGKDGEIYWHSPDPRAIFPLKNPKMPKKLRNKIINKQFTFTINYDFPYVIKKCSDRRETWINDDIIKTYIKIHKMGYANSVEAWKDGEIVGGLYGVTIKGAFFGESMFNDISDAAKAAFYFLVDNMKHNNFLLLDSQYINPFTRKLGAVEIPKELYFQLLNKALALDVKLK